jgi:hypothetical protein
MRQNSEATIDIFRGNHNFYVLSLHELSSLLQYFILQNTQLGPFSAPSCIAAITNCPILIGSVLIKSVTTY